MTIAVPLDSFVWNACDLFEKVASIGANTLNFTDLGSQSPYEGGGPPSTPHSGMDADGNAALPTAPNKSAFVELQQHGYENLPLSRCLRRSIIFIFIHGEIYQLVISHLHNYHTPHTQITVPIHANITTRSSWFGYKMLRHRRAIKFNIVVDFMRFLWPIPEDLIATVFFCILRQVSILLRCSSPSSVATC